MDTHSRGEIGDMDHAILRNVWTVYFIAKIGVTISKFWQQQTW